MVNPVASPSSNADTNADTNAAPSSGAESAPDDVCVVGAANMDIAGHSRAALLRGDSNPGEIEFSPGGVARNVAENLARLGRPSRRVHLISAVGADDFGRRLITATQASGVDVGLVGVFEDARTATYLALHGPNGDMALAVNDMAILARLSVAHLTPFKAVLENAACTVLDCNLSAEALRWLLEDCDLGPVFVDGVSAAKCGRQPTARDGRGQRRHQPRRKRCLLV